MTLSSLEHRVAVIEEMLRRQREIDEVVLHGIKEAVAELLPWFIPKQPLYDKIDEIVGRIEAIRNRPFR